MKKTTRLAGKHSQRVELSEWIAKEREASQEFRAAHDAARQATHIARALAELRQRRGLSQGELAKRLGTSQQAVSRLEHPDYHGHTLRMLVRYAEALGARLEFHVAEA
jgi:ribosome-binding protein aMBF1 (putative translation factor)